MVVISFVYLSQASLVNKMNRRAQTLIETILKIVKNIFDFCPFIFICSGENFTVLSRFNREISPVDEFVDVIFCAVEFFNQAISSKFRCSQSQSQNRFEMNDSSIKILSHCCTFLKVNNEFFLCTFYLYR